MILRPTIGSNERLKFFGTSREIRYLSEPVEKLLASV
jgi:hypothetical protein